jgi:hypothetical protein
MTWLIGSNGSSGGCDAGWKVTVTDIPRALLNRISVA